MNYLGIEIGGTKLQIGLGPGDGTLAALWRGPVDVAAGADGIRAQITAAVPELLKSSGLGRSQLGGVGIGFGGPVDDASHTIIKSHQIEGWDNFPLAGWISEFLGLPAALGNDADVAGLGEAHFGAGKGFSPVFYVTIGSGIGGGLVLDGEIYRGSGRGAAEIGHLVVIPARFPRAVPDILEHYASGWAIGDAARQWPGDEPGIEELTALAEGDPQRINATHVAQAARRGNPLGRAVLDRALDCLAQAVCHVIALLNPRRIVIGGGVSLMGDEVLFEPLRRLVAQRAFKPFAGSYQIVPAALGEEVVVHGALALARRRLEDRKS